MVGVEIGYMGKLDERKPIIGSTNLIKVSPRGTDIRMIIPSKKDDEPREVEVSMEVIDGINFGGS